MKITTKLIMFLALSCSIQIVTAETSSNDAAKNLLKYDFSAVNSAGIPEGFTATVNKVQKGSVSVINEDGSNIVKMELPEKSRGFIDSTATVGLKAGKKYVFSIMVKIDNQNIAPKGFSYVCLYNTGNNEHIYYKFMGAGSTGGWITVIIFVDTIKKSKLVDSKIFLRVYDCSGTYFFKNPVLVEVPDDTKLETQIMLKNNMTMPGAFANIGEIMQLNK